MRVSICHNHDRDGGVAEIDILDNIMFHLEHDVVTEETRRALVDLFPLEQVTLWALQIALMIAIRSNTPEHLLIHFCPLIRYETTSSGLSSLQDIHP